MISPAARDALQSWLDMQKALKGASDNTIDAYCRDVGEFLAFMTDHHGQTQGLQALARISVADMRSWMAFARGQGVGPRSLARKLSALEQDHPKLRSAIRLLKGWRRSQKPRDCR